jgi:hypothetical protein
VVTPTRSRALQLARWLPVGAGLIYAEVLLRRLHDIVNQLTWNADYVSQMVAQAERFRQRLGYWEARITELDIPRPRG